jgi:hypothetical protein
MSKHSKQTDPETKTIDEAPPAGEAPADVVPPAASQSAAESADLKPGPGGAPDPAAQAKISAQAGVSSGDLASELGALPNIAALEGIKANARAGYYRGVPAEELARDLSGLTFESDEHSKIRDALVERAKGGAFSGQK